MESALRSLASEHGSGNSVSNFHLKVHTHKIQQSRESMQC